MLFHLLSNISLKKYTRRKLMKKSNASYMIGINYIIMYLISSYHFNVKNMIRFFDR